MMSGKDKTLGQERVLNLKHKSARRVRGLFTGLITPFDGRGRVDPERLSELVEFQISKGTEGLFPCGSTGLGPMLSIEERKTVAETVLKSSRGRVPVVVQVGCTDTSSTVELARHAERFGAEAVASLPPFYYKPGERAIAKHFETIANSVSIPLFAYNIPLFTGNNLQPVAVASMAKEGTISGIKDSSRDLLQLLDLLDAVPDDFIVMNGTEEYGLFAIMTGADGLVSGAASALPELFKSMVAAYRNGDLEKALAAQKTVLSVKILVKQGPIPAYYDILRERGIDCGLPRAPFLPTKKKTVASIMNGLRGLMLL
jgi:N-acetylneuraminate lyase/4-hydroxy-tetrahydrodipicolinate synthase